MAEAPVHLGASVAADVAEFERTDRPEDGGAAVATYSPPAAMFTMPATFPPEFHVEVRDRDRDRDRDRARLLVAVVGLISPANKDRPEAREFFAAKLASYLQTGVGVIIADVVTDMQFNLHNELARLGAYPAELSMAADVFIYASAYRPVHRGWEDGTCGSSR